MLTPALFIATILLLFNVLWPARPLAGLPLLTAIVVGAALFGVLYVGFELEIVSYLLARFVGRHWASEVEGGDSWLRHFFYVEDRAPRDERGAAFRDTER
jgi:hypothetical protein